MRLFEVVVCRSNGPTDSPSRTECGGCCGRANERRTPWSRERRTIRITQLDVAIIQLRVWATRHPAAAVQEGKSPSSPCRAPAASNMPLTMRKAAARSRMPRCGRVGALPERCENCFLFFRSRWAVEHAAAGSQQRQTTTCSQCARAERCLQRRVRSYAVQSVWPALAHLSSGFSMPRVCACHAAASLTQHGAAGVDAEP